MGCYQDELINIFQTKRMKYVQKHIYSDLEKHENQSFWINQTFVKVSVLFFNHVQGQIEILSQLQSANYDMKRWIKFWFNTRIAMDFFSFFVYNLDSTPRSWEIDKSLAHFSKRHFSTI